MLRTIAREWPIAGLLVLFGILYGAGLSAYGMFMWDEAEYASIARSVARGDGFSISGRPNSLRPPVLPLAGAASMLLAGDQFDDGVLRATGCAFAILVLLCVYGFAAAAFDRATGLIAAALLGLSPVFWISATLFMAEMPFMAFFAAAVWFFYFGVYRSERLFVWSWISWALAFLTRYTALLFLPLMVVFLAIALWMDRQTLQRILNRWCFLSPIAALLVILPWLMRQYVTFGNPLAGFKWASKQLQSYVPDVSMPWHFYLGHLPANLSLPIALLFLAGLAWTISKRDRFALHCVLAAAFILVWFSCYRYKEDRLASSALPFVAVIAGAGLASAAAFLRPMTRAVVISAVLAGIFVLNFRVTRSFLQHSITLGYPSFLDAMAYLRVHSSPSATVLGANFPQIFWYTNLRAIDFPDERDLQEALRRSEWVVITNFERGQKPYVSSLVDKIAGDADTRSGIQEFRDSRYVTLLIRSENLLRAPGRR